MQEKVPFLMMALMCYYLDEMRKVGFQILFRGTHIKEDRPFSLSLMKTYLMFESSEETLSYIEANGYVIDK